MSSPAFWVLVACVVYVAQVSSEFARAYHFHVVDDAYISFQYARNWVSGHGLVFNPGQYVEGYTNFLWVVILAPFYALSQALSVDFTTMAIGLSIVISLLNLALVYAIAQRLFDRDWFATSVALLLCAVDNAYLGYAMSALENPLLSFWILAAAYAWLRRSRLRWLGTGIAMIAATMTRPDAGLLVACFGLSSLVGVVITDPSRPEDTRRKIAKHAASAIGVFVIGYGAYFAWRYAYYGALLPNTFYLKIGTNIDATERGLRYSLSFLEDRYYVPALAAIAVIWPRHTIVRWMLLYAVVHATYVAYVGGDFYSGHRFYVALLPVFALLVGWVLHRLRARAARLRPAQWLCRRPARMAVTIGFAGAALAFGLSHLSQRGFQRGPWAHEIRMWGDKVHNNVLFTEWLGTFTEPGESIVVGDIGSAGFLTDLVVHDVYGVIDPVIARKEVKNFGHGKAGHEKRASRSYLLERKPTYVKWGYVPGDLRPFGYYLFTEFPPGFRQPALWVREDLGNGRFLPGTAIHFRPADLKNWRTTGNAFDRIPTTRPIRGQHHVFGQGGAYINSFLPGAGDRATGTLVSPRIRLQGDRMILQVGGGRDHELLRVSLLVDGVRVRSATGHDHEVLGRRVWNIEPYRGKMGQIEIVDRATEVWGHILVDEIVQWVVEEESPR